MLRMKVPDTTPAGAESHFAVTAVGAVFAEHSRIARHRLVNKLLQSEFDCGMHACCIFIAKTNGCSGKIRRPSRLTVLVQ